MQGMQLETPTKSHLALTTNTPPGAGPAGNGMSTSPCESQASASSQLEGNSRRHPPIMHHAQHRATESTSFGDSAAMEAQWASLFTNIKGHSHSAAELLMAQAASTAQMDEFVKSLLLRLQTKEDESAMLEAQLRRDRSEFTGQARTLSQHFATAQHKSMALQVVHEALQGELRTTKEALTAAQQQVAELEQQLDQSRAQVSNEQGVVHGLQAELKARQSQLLEQQQQCEEQRSIAKELRAAKGALQAQLSCMVAAERELTDHLKETHQQIHQQLATLQEQLKSERQRRAAVSRRRTELQHQNAVLTSRLAALEQQHQDPRAGARDQKSDRSEGGGDTLPRKDQQAPVRQAPASTALRTSGTKPLIRLGLLRHPSRGPAATTLRRGLTARTTRATAPPARQSPPAPNTNSTAADVGPAATPAAADPAPSRRAATQSSLHANASVRIQAGASPGAQRGVPHQPHPVATPASSVTSHSSVVSGPQARSSQHSLRSASHTPGTVHSHAGAQHSGRGASQTPTSRLTAGQSAAGRPARPPINTTSTPPTGTATGAASSHAAEATHGTSPIIMAASSPAQGGTTSSQAATTATTAAAPAVTLSSLGQPFEQHVAHMGQVYTLSMCTPVRLPTAASQLAGSEQQAGSGHSTPFSDMYSSQGAQSHGNTSTYTTPQFPFATHAKGDIAKQGIVTGAFTANQQLMLEQAQLGVPSQGTGQPPLGSSCFHSQGGGSGDGRLPAVQLQLSSEGGHMQMAVQQAPSRQELAELHASLQRLQIQQHMQPSTDEERAGARVQHQMLEHEPASTQLEHASIGMQRQQQHLQEHSWPRENAQSGQGMPGLDAPQNTAVPLLGQADIFRAQHLEGVGQEVQGAHELWTDQHQQRQQWPLPEQQHVSQAQGQLQVQQLLAGLRLLQQQIGLPDVQQAPQ